MYWKCFSFTNLWRREKWRFFSIYFLCCLLCFTFVTIRKFHKFFVFFALHTNSVFCVCCACYCWSLFISFVCTNFSINRSLALARVRWQIHLLFHQWNQCCQPANCSNQLLNVFLFCSLLHCVVVIARLLLFVGYFTPHFNMIQLIDRFYAVDYFVAGVLSTFFIH